jgi:hypothetical protein
MSAVLLALCACCSSDECALDDDLRQFAGNEARDCGSARAGGDRSDVDACVAEAFEAGEPFIARYELQGLDSKVVAAVASNSEGTVELFQWDSAPCGGPGCAPVTDVQLCEGPALRAKTSGDSLALPISCDRVGLSDRVCG